VSNTIKIYVPEKLKAQLVILPARTVSRICQDALKKAVAAAEQLRDEQLRDEQLRDEQLSDLLEED
jgi:hypothetical protein